MRVIWSHAGGTMPFLIRRFDKRVKESPEFQPILPEGFSPEARKFYYDVAQAPERAPMAALRAVAPVSQLLFGTDWPHQTTEEHVTGLKNSGVFSAAELQGDRPRQRAAADADVAACLDLAGQPRIGEDHVAQAGVIANIAGAAAYMAVHCSQYA